jgi:uncharacterized membrane protein
MEALLHSIAQPIALAIQAVAIAFVTAGSAVALVKAVRMLMAGTPSAGEFQAIWLNHARWLVAGLTFLLAADIVETSFSPTWNELGRLAAVAVIRTFLSYFLDREMECAERLVARSSTKVQE